MDNNLLPEVEKKIITLRNQQVILANHVADLYGVETREVNQAVKNNPEKFPEGYIFELNKKEKEEVVKNFDNLGKILYSPTNPKAFTEKGLYMLATILKSPKATETTLAIVEAYAKLKELSRVIVEIPQQEDKSTEQQVLLHRGGQLVEDIMSDNDHSWELIRKKCELLEKNIIFAPWNNDEMEITFEQDYLRELYYDGVTCDKQHRYQPQIVKKYIRVVNILDSVEKAVDLYRYRALHYEKLVGNKAGLESVRVNDQYRVEFKTSAKGGITICNITELSKHYKKK